MTRRFEITMALLAAATGLACDVDDKAPMKASSDAAMTATDGGTGLALGQDASVDAGTADAGAAGGSGGGAKVGFVQVTSNSLMAAGMTFGSTSALATFGTAPSVSGEPNACIEKKAGPCTVVTCSTTSQDGGAAPSAASDAGVSVAPNVGRIDITGGLAPLALVPTAAGTYELVTTSNALWTGPTKLTLTAAGATIPAFPATMIEAPLAVKDLKLNGKAPPALGMRASLAKGDPLALAWADGSSDVTVALSQVAGAKTVSARCQVPASSGVLTVPPEVLEQLAPGDATLVIGQSARTVVRAGDYDVTLSVATAPSPALLLVTVP